VVAAVHRTIKNQPAGAPGMAAGIVGM